MDDGAGEPRSAVAVDDRDDELRAVMDRRRRSDRVRRGRRCRLPVRSAARSGEPDDDDDERRQADPRS
jgi:hypothetical protein